MTYRTNAFAQKLDRLAEYTGVPAFQRLTRRETALPFRFVPLFPLLFAAAGLFLQIRFPNAGWLSVMLAWVTSMPLLLAGPMRLPPGGAYDEREQALVNFGRIMGLGAVALFAIGGCFLFGMLNAMAMVRLAPVWLPSIPTDWFALAFFLMVLHGSVSVMAVSWKIPRVQEADEIE